MWLCGKNFDGHGTHTKASGENAYLFSVLEKSTLLKYVAGNRLKDLASNVSNSDLKISIARRESQSTSKGTSKDTFIGTYKDDYLVAEKGRLEQTIADYTPQEFPCPYNPSTGRTACLYECITSTIDEVGCPEQELHHAERELLRLEMRPYLTLAFSYPSVAAANDLLDRDDIAISQL
jgi:hypothetical protein